MHRRKDHGEKEETTKENSVYMESDADAGRSDRYDRSMFFKVLLKVAERGDGIEQSFEQALYWMKEAEEKGDKDAPYHISVCSEILDLQKKASAGDMAAMASRKTRRRRLSFSRNLPSRATGLRCRTLGGAISMA